MQLYNIPYLQQWHVITWFARHIILSIDIRFRSDIGN